MTEYILAGGSVYGETKTFSPGFVWIAGGMIKEAGPASQLHTKKAGVPVYRVPSQFHLLPGAIDVHIHGASGADVMDGSAESLRRIAAFLPSEGTTSFLATTMTQKQPKIEQALQAIASYKNEIGTAALAGVHVEGPFISAKHPGAQPAEAIQAPNVPLFQKWQALSGSRIKLVTLAPEVPGSLALIKSLVKQNITVSAGHTDATFSELTAAADAGVSHITHLYNGMRGLHHREPGTAGGALLLPSLFAEMIVDGIHIHPDMVRLAFRQKTAEKTILITDSMRAKGLSDGTYDLGGQAVTVTEGKATLAGGVLAGSTLSMQQAIRNMRAFTGCTMEEIVQMTAENPAKQAGLWNRTGSIAPGKAADIVVYNESMRVQTTICRGEIAFERKNLL